MPYDEEYSYNSDDSEKLRPGDPAFNQIYEPRMRHSGFGVASTIAGLVLLFLNGVIAPVFINSIIAFGQRGGGGGAFTSQFFTIYSLVSTGVMILFPLAGLVLGVVALSQPGTRREYAYTGLAINGILMLSGIVSFGARFLVGMLW
jgi:hypothetical protein